MTRRPASCLPGAASRAGGGPPAAGRSGVECQQPGSVQSAAPDPGWAAWPIGICRVRPPAEFRDKRRGGHDLARAVTKRPGRCCHADGTAVAIIPVGMFDRLMRSLRAAGGHDGTVQRPRGRSGGGRPGRRGGLRPVPRRRPGRLPGLARPGHDHQRWRLRRARVPRRPGRPGRPARVVPAAHRVLVRVGRAWRPPCGSGTRKSAGPACTRSSPGTAGITSS